MKYKKIIPTFVALGIFTFGGLGCTKEPQEPILKKGNEELRLQICRYLKNEPYTLNTDKHEITVSTESDTVYALVVTIKNKYTKDTLKLYDYSANGNVDLAKYNEISSGTEGMDERFDKALELIKPKLEQKAKKSEEDQKLLINKVRENTKLN